MRKRSHFLGGDASPASELLAEEIDAGSLWGPEDFGAILSHRLLVEVRLDSDQADAKTSYGALLRNPAPLWSELEQLAAYSRSASANPDAPLPGAVADVLYFAAAAAGVARCRRRLLNLDDQALLQGLQWVASEPWVDADVRKLCADAIGLLDEAAPKAAHASCEALPHTSEPAASPHYDIPRLTGYQLLSPLGEGGMGVVWKAIQLNTRREVALKVLSPAQVGSRKARLRFEREVELACRLDHPNIARVYDSGASDGPCFYVMELVGGTHLDDYVSESKFGVRELLFLMEQTCRAVHYAHQHGVIHRDLKPSNILVTRDGIVKVVDFGLARDLDDSKNLTLTAGSFCGGTPAFMSPEQACGDTARFGTASDIYSLGATLYLLLTGHPPHDLSGSRMQVLDRIGRCDVQSPRKLCAEMSRDLEAILLKALAKDPQRRYASAAELASDISRYLAGEPITARPPTLAYLVCRRAARHWPSIIAAGLLLGVLTGLGINSARRIRVARDVAVKKGAYAEEQRRKFEDSARLAEERLTDSIFMRAEVRSEADHWIEATQDYEQGWSRLVKEGRPTRIADIGLTKAYLAAPPPLNTFHGLRCAVTATAISPDERFAAAAGADGSIHLWDLRTSTPVSVLLGHEERVFSIEFSPDSSKLLSGGEDGTARVWDVRSGFEVQRCVYPEEVKKVAWSPESRAFATGTKDGEIKIWDVGSDLNRCTWFVGGWPSAIAFTDGGRTCVAGGQWGILERRDAATGTHIGGYYWSDKYPKEVYAHPNGVSGVSFSADGKWCISCGANTSEGDDFTVRLWDAATGNKVNGYRFAPAGVVSVQFHPDYRFALCAGADGIIRLVHAETGWVRKSFYGHTSPLTNVAFSKGGSLAISGDANGKVNLWDLGFLTEYAMAAAEPSEVCAIVPLAGGQAVVSTDRDGFRLSDAFTMRDIYRISSHPPARVLPDPSFYTGAHAGAVSMAMSSDGQSTLCGFNDGAIVLFNTRDGKNAKYLGQMDANVRSVAFCHDGRAALSVNGNFAQLRGLSTGDLLWSSSADATIQEGIGFRTSPQLSLLLATGHGHLFSIDLATGAVAPKMVALSIPVDIKGNCVFIKGGDEVVFGCADGIYVCDCRTGTTRTIKAEKSPVTAVDVSPDGALLVSGHFNGEVKIWDFAEGRELLTLLPHHGQVCSVKFSPAGDTVFTGGHDGGLRAWDLARAAKYRNFEPRVTTARLVLQSNPRDAAALRTLGEWYAFRKRWQWGAQTLEEAQRNGASVSHLTLGRCYLQQEDPNPIKAESEFRLALSRDEDSKTYLEWCINSTRSER